MLVNMNQMLKEAKEGHYAIPHFNIKNLEWAKYILEECNRLNSPVILGVSESAVKYMGGYKTVTLMVRGLVDELNITCPVALHLDHGSSFDSCQKAIEAGFTSVMIDASKYPLDENIALTNRVSEFAKEYNVSVEAEIGRIGGVEDDVSAEPLYADVRECIKMATETTISCLAPALGSAHGLYKGEPKLDFLRMLEIGRCTDLPLVLHGATGIPDSMIKKAIEAGTCKINFDTELQIAWHKDVTLYLAENPNTYDPRKVIGSGSEAIKKVVRNKVELFNSINRN